MSRKAHSPDPAQRQQVETMAAYGIPENDITLVLGIDPKTLRSTAMIWISRKPRPMRKSWAGDATAKLVTASDSCSIMALHQLLFLAFDLTCWRSCSSP